MGGGNILSELDLINLERIGTISSLIGPIILLISTNIATMVEKAKQKDIKLTTSPTSSQVTLKGAQFNMFGNIMLLVTAILRIQQRAKQIETGTSPGGTLIPNKWVIIGALFAVLGSVYLVTGVKLRIDEEGQISII